LVSGKRFYGVIACQEEPQRFARRGHWVAAQSQSCVTLSAGSQPRSPIGARSASVGGLIEFFEALVADAGRKVFLILDNLGVHHCKPVEQWLAGHSEQMEVFYLPSYSPELNPEERLNADLKQVIGRKVPVRTKAKLRAAAEQHMEVIGREPERVKAYFCDPRVKYAA
jgi:transposase